MPVPNFDLSALNTIAAYAQDLVDLVDTNGFLWVVAAFALITAVLSWAIRTIDNPPRF